MSGWCIVVVVSEDTVVVSEELTAEDCLVVTSNIGAEPRDEKVAALSGLGCGGCSKRG